MAFDRLSGTTRQASLISPAVLLFLLAGLMPSGLAASAQTTSTSTPPAVKAPAQTTAADLQETVTDISIGVPSLFTTTRETAVGGGGQLTDYSYLRGVQGTFHQQFTPLLGYNVNVSWARPNEPYSAALPPSNNPNPASLVATGSVPTNLYEITAGYVAKAPFVVKRLQVFGQVGGGVLHFSPAGSPYPIGSATRGAALVGAGFDYNFMQRFGARIEYRSLYYENPSLHSQPANAVVTIPNSPLITLTNEITVSLTYRFRHFIF